MERESVVAMDFLGIEASHSKETSENERAGGGTLVRPKPSLFSFKASDHSSQSFSTSLGNGPVRKTPPQVSCNQAAAFLRARGWSLPESKESDSVAEAAPGKQSASTERSSSLDKPLEELTDADIMQLTREDCRRYLKEKGMRRPSWNKFQAIQQVLSLKGLFDCKTSNEKAVCKKGSFPKDCTEVASDDVLLPSLKVVSNGLPSQGRGTTEVHSFFSTAKEGLGLATAQRKGVFAEGQCQMPQSMDENHESPFLVDSTSSHLLNSDLTLSLSSQAKGSLSSKPGGFGSPLPSLSTFNWIPGTTFPTFQETVVNNAQEQSPSQGTAASSEQGARPSSGYVKAPTAQLTIFYAGYVNIYEDVSADKAQAIMLLAASGNQWASSTMRPPASADYHVSAPVVAANPSVPASPPAGDHHRDDISPPVSSVLFDPVALNQHCVRHCHNELPQARKASLQRFLEKRKERAIAKAPYIVKKSETDGSACDTSPSSVKALEAGSAPSDPLPQYSLSAAFVDRSSKSCGSEISSPCRVPSKKIVVNSEEKRRSKVDVEKHSEKSETVNSNDEKMMETEEDAASSQA